MTESLTARAKALILDIIKSHEMSPNTEVHLEVSMQLIEKALLDFAEAAKADTSEEQGFDFYDPKIIKFISDTIYKWHVEVKDGQLWQDERKIKYVMQAALSHASKARVPEKKNPKELFGQITFAEEHYADGWNDCIDEFLRLNPEWKEKK